MLDMVIGSNSGHIWALDGDSIYLIMIIVKYFEINTGVTGNILPNFPMRLGGRVNGRTIVADLLTDGGEMRR